MKVVWVNRSEWKKPGPIVYIGILNALSFAKLGHETHFFVSEGKPSDTDQDLVEFYGLEPHDKLTIHRIPKGSKMAEIPGRSIYRKAYAFCKRELDTDESILLMSRELGFTGFMARLQRRYPSTLKTLYEAHDFHADLSGRNGEIDFNDRRKKITERIFLPRLSGLLCITPPQEDFYRAALPNLNLFTQALGCLEHSPLSDQETEERRSRRTVIYVGHLHRYKGVHDLLDQADFFKKHDLKLHLLGGNANQIEKFRKKLGEDSPIHFFPSMPPSQLHEHMEKHASIGIVPLQDSYYNRSLTCPVKALDTLSHHMPVIASDLPTTRAVIADAGVYLPPNHPEKFPEAIQELIDDPENFRQLSLNAGKRARELSWKNRAQRILNWDCQ